MRVSNYYDKEEKESFFMVRGDERYARSTKTIISLGTPVNNSQTNLDFSLDVTVNVLRDVGSAYITIYDNDVPVYVINNWSATDNARTITLTGLNYDTQHNFQAKYMGNNSCSPSLSDIKTLTVQGNRGNSTLTIDNTTLQFNPNGTLTKIITLTNTLNTAYNHAQNIKVFYDGNVVKHTVEGEETDIYTTANDGNTISVTVADVGDNGLHEIKAVYYGSNHLKSTEVTQNISVGYNVKVVNTPIAFVYGDIESKRRFAATVYDWFGSHVGSGITVRVQKDDLHYYGSATTNSKGKVEIYPTNLKDTLTRGDYDDVELEFKTTISATTYKSSKFTVHYYVPKSITVSTSESILSKDNITVLSVDSGFDASKLYVRVTDGLGEFVTSARTNSEGIAVLSFTGDGIGEKQFTVGLGDITKSLTFQDYIQYWSSDLVRNQDYGVLNASLMKLATLFRFVMPNSTNILLFGLPVDNGIDYELIISGLSTNKTATISYVKDWNGSVDNFNISIPSASHVSYSNATLRVTRIGGTVSFYKGETLIGSYSGQNNYCPLFSIFASSNGINVDFRTLTLQQKTDFEEESEELLEELIGGE